MSITLSPLVPPDTGESPTLGAQRIRNVSAFLLQMFGFTGTVAETLAVAPVSSTDLTTGIMTLPNKLTLGAVGVSGLDAVAVNNFVNSNNQSGYCKFPGGFIVQWAVSGLAGTGATIALPTSFTTSGVTAHWVAMGTTTDGTGVALGVAPLGVNTVTITFTGGGARAIAILAAGF